MSDFEQQIRLLTHSLSQEQFRFILIRYNHRSIIGEVKGILQKFMPGRSCHPIWLAGKNYEEITSTLALEVPPNSILLVEDFYQVLQHPLSSSSLNQAGSRLASLPLALLCFLPAGTGTTEESLDRSLDECRHKLPALWPLRSLVLELEAEVETSGKQTKTLTSPVSGSKVWEKERDLNHLKVRLLSLQQNEDAQFPALVSCYQRLIDLMAEVGAYHQGLEYALAFLDLLQRKQIQHKAPLLLAETYSCVGEFLRYTGRAREVMPYLEQALALAEQQQDEASISKYTNNMGLIYRDMGEARKSIEWLEKALDAALRIFGETHPAVAITQSNLANAYVEIASYDRARNLLEQALYSGIRHFGANHPSVAMRQSNLANVYRKIGDYQTALHLLEEALASVIQQLGEQHPVTATYFNNLGWICRQTRDYKRAKTLFEKAYRIRLHTLGQDHPDTMDVKKSLDFVTQRI